MVVKYEELNANEVKVYIESTPEQVEKKIKDAYNRNKSKYNVKGFRPGKAPQKIIEQMYGVEVFLNDAFDLFIQEELMKAIEEKKLETYGDPKFGDIVVEKDKMAFSAVLTILVMPKFGEYKGIEVPDLKPEVSDEEIDEEIKKEIKKNARLIEVTDRVAQDGDVLTVDFVGTIDGVEFDGGKGEGITITLGEGRFIPGFEEQLIGAAKDSDVTVKVKFPDDYGSEEVAGKDAEFAVKVHDIKIWENPEFNDEFVSDISEFETVDEYKESIKTKLVANKEIVIKKQKEDYAIATLVKNSEINLPEQLINDSVSNDKENFVKRLESYGMNLEYYYQMSGRSEEELNNELAEESKKALVESYLLLKLAQHENLALDEKQLEDLFVLKAAQYRMTVEELKKEVAKRPNMMEYMVEEAMKEAAIKLIMDNSVNVDPDKLPKLDESAETVE